MPYRNKLQEKPDEALSAGLRLIDADDEDVPAPEAEPQIQ